MKSFLRRIQKLEKAKEAAAAEAASLRDLLARIEAGRLYSEKCANEGRARGEKSEAEGVRFQVPASRKAALGGDIIGLMARINLGRERVWREGLFAKCQASLAETASAATEEGRAAAAAQADEVERKCQQNHFASIEAFLGNCREGGWLRDEST